MLKTTYDRALLSITAIGVSAAVAWVWTDRTGKQTIVARFESVQQTCRDEMINQAKSRSCSGKLVTDKKLITVDWKNWNNTKGLVPGQMYAFPARGLGYTDTPALNGPPRLVAGQ